MVLESTEAQASCARNRTGDEAGLEWVLPVRQCAAWRNSSVGKAPGEQAFFPIECGAPVLWTILVLFYAY